MMKTIQKGDTLPAATLYQMGKNGPQAVDSKDILGKGKIVLFAIPGAFTPTCSDGHLPSYLQHGEALLDKGVDRIVCVVSNDPFVIDAWAKQHNVGDNITMLSDGNGDFARALGVEIDAGAFGLGKRSGRYAMVLENGTVTHFQNEEGVGLACSRGQDILDLL